MTGIASRTRVSGSKREEKGKKKGKKKKEIFFKKNEFSSCYKKKSGIEKRGENGGKIDGSYSKRR